MYITICTDNMITSVTSFSDLDPKSILVSNSFRNYPQYLDQLSKIIDEVKKQLKLSQPKGIGIAHTGHIDTATGIIIHASHVPDYNGHNICKDLQEGLTTKAPVYIENDSACAGIAEAYFGEGKNFETLGVVFLSWGIGGSYIKKVKNSYSLFTVELGHQIVTLNGKACVCGQRGCLEAYVGAEAIKKRFLVDQDKLDDLRIWEDLVNYIAIGAVNLHTLFMPEVLIISGKTINEVEYVKEVIIDRIQERLRRKTPVMIQFSSFNELGPSIGALALLKIKEGGNSIQNIE